MSSPELVDRLQSELRHESTSRRLQEELNARLQGEYDALLKKLAEAELHIDRLRLGATIDITRKRALSRGTGEELSCNSSKLKWPSSSPPLQSITVVCS